MTSSSLRQAGITMVVVTIAARGIGFLRESVIAYSFGASQEVDLFLVSLTLPAILITTAYYSIPNAFVPLWSSSSSRQRYTVGMALILVASALAIAAIVWWFAAPAIRLLAGGFDREMQERAVTLLRVGSVAIVFAVIEALLRSRLLAAKRFALSGLSYVWQAVGMIIAALWWRDSGATALMWGLVAGTAVSAFWNLSILFASGDLVPRTQESHSTTMSPSQVLIWISLVLITDSLSQLYAVVDRHFGSFLEPGAIAALNYANLTAGMPTGIIALALSTAILPFLADADSAKDTDRTRMIIDRAVRWAVLIAVPITVWMLVFCAEITAVLFQRGAFDAHALRVTSSALSAAALGIIPVALAAVWSRPFYASRAWKPIAITAISALISKGVFSAALVPKLGSTGLALSTSGAFLVTACLTGFMQRTHIRSNLYEWGGVVCKSLLLVAAPAIAGYALIQLFGSENLLIRGSVAAVSIITGFALLIFGGARWQITQMAELETLLRHRRPSRMGVSQK